MRPRHLLRSATGRFAVEFLLWWHEAGSHYYGRSRGGGDGEDEGLQELARDAVQTVGGWRVARYLLRRATLTPELPMGQRWREPEWSWRAGGARAIRIRREEGA